MSYNWISCSLQHNSVDVQPLWLVLVPLHCCNRVIQTEVGVINNIMYFSQVEGLGGAEDQGTTDSLSGEGHISAHRRPPSPWGPYRQEGSLGGTNLTHEGTPSESNQFQSHSPPKTITLWGVCFSIWILERHKHSVYHICILKMG